MESLIIFSRRISFKLHTNRIVRHSRLAAPIHSVGRTKLREDSLPHSSKLSSVPLLEWQRKPSRPESVSADSQMFPFTHYKTLLCGATGGGKRERNRSDGGMLGCPQATHIQEGNDKTGLRTFTQGLRYGLLVNRLHKNATLSRQWSRSAPRPSVESPSWRLRRRDQNRIEAIPGVTRCHFSSQI
jgi:hypothetical protein